MKLKNPTATEMGKKRWQKIPKEKRKEMMRALAIKRWNPPQINLKHILLGSYE